MTIDPSRLLINANPLIYAELHPTMNTIDTTKLTVSNGKKVWWQCIKEPAHYWKARVACRTTGRGCAMCTNQYVVHGVNDLSVLNPNLYSEIHSTMNTINTTTLSPGSSKKIWWQCRMVVSHYWEAKVTDRTRGNGCAMCAGKYVVHGINDLSVLNPSLYSEIHPTMNTINTTTLSLNSHNRVWWQCRKDLSHYWETTVNSRTRGQGCGMCHGLYVAHGVNDLSAKHPDLYAELHPTMNTIDTKSLSHGSKKQVWWQCMKNTEHYWKATVNSRTSGQGCAMCAGKYVVHGVNDLSILSSGLYSEIHPTMNTIDITTLSQNSSKKVWWQCMKNTEHYWKATVNSRTSGQGCAMCAGKYVVHGVNDLSFINPNLYAELHPTMNTIDTTILAVSSSKKVWWQCPKNTSHYWKSTVYDRACGHSCGMCAGQYIVYGINDLSVLRPELYAELHPTMNTIDTTILAVSSSKKVWWQCPKNTLHYWEALVSSRAFGNGCPHCVTYRNESEFRTLFTEVTNLEFRDGHVVGERELFKRDKIQIDMINHENNVVIEYDGAWTHGGNKLYKTTLEHCLARDTDTTSTLLKAGYKVVRIRETPLQFLDLQHDNLFQLAFKDRDDKLPVVMSAVEALQTMGVEIEIRRSEVNELQ